MCTRAKSRDARKTVGGPGGEPAGQGAAGEAEVHAPAALPSSRRPAVPRPRKYLPSVFHGLAAGGLKVRCVGSGDVSPDEGRPDLATSTLAASNRSDHDVDILFPLRVVEWLLAWWRAENSAAARRRRSNNTKAFCRIFGRWRRGHSASSLRSASRSRPAPSVSPFAHSRCPTVIAQGGSPITDAAKEFNWCSESTFIITSRFGINEPTRNRLLPRV